MKFKKIMMTAAAITMLFAAGAHAEMPEENKPKDMDAVLFYAEFDGNDDTTYWASFDQGGKYRENSSAGEVKNDGTLMVNNTKTGYGWWGAYFGVLENALPLPKDKQDVYIETRFKITADYKNLDLIRVFGTRISDNNNLNFVNIKTSNNALAGKNEDGENVSYPMSANVWYTIKVRLDFLNENVYYTVSDDDGNEESFVSNFVYKSLGNKDISSFMVLRNADNVCDKYIDYVMLWDEEFRPTATSIENNAQNVSSDTDYSIKFLGGLDQNTMSNITVADSEGNAVETEITYEDKYVKLYFPAGLRYDEKYTVNIPKSVKDINGTASREGTYTFTTESKPFLIGDIKTSISSNKANASVTIKNSGTADRDMYLLMAVYDSEGKMIKMKNVPFTTKAESEETFTAECDITGTENASVKAYVWNGYEIRG